MRRIMYINLDNKRIKFDYEKKYTSYIRGRWTYHFQFRSKHTSSSGYSSQFIDLTPKMFRKLGAKEIAKKIVISRNLLIN